MGERLVVVGGDAAGMSAASQARRLRPDLEIVALEKGRWTSYSACGIPYLVAGDVARLEDLVVRDPQTFRDRYLIDARTGHEVVGIDLAVRRLEVRDHAHDRTYSLGFDLLHLGLGLGAVPADLVVLGLGVRPNTRLAAEAGLATGAAGAIRVDVLPGVVGTAVAKVCETEVARTGLNEAEAAGAGFEFEAVRISSTTRAGYLSQAGRIEVKMLAERGSGRLLGAQLVGVEGAAKRIDVVATALTAGMTVEEMTALDLSYAPPFSPVWDPVLVAARKAAEAVSQR